MGRKRNREAVRAKLKSYADIDARLREQKSAAQSQAALWDYLCGRFNEFWKQNNGPKRHVPQNWHDPDYDTAGWFFPVKWVQDFETLPPGQRQPKPQPERRPERSPEERLAYVQAIMAAFQNHDAVPPREAESWQLPAATQITLSEVIYPDGRRETIEAARLRHFSQANRTSPGQENLEAMLRMQQRWYDKPLLEEDAAKPSPGLLAALKRKWHVMGGKWPMEAA